MLKKVLENIGLNEKEAKVYLANIQLGLSPASKIAKKAGLNRVTVYDILLKLIEKGFVTRHKKKDTYNFSAVDPEILAMDFESKSRDFKESVGDFKRLTGETSHPQIQYFEGIEVIKKIYLDTLSAKDEMLSYANPEKIVKYWPNHYKEYVPERMKRNIYLKAIAPNNAKSREVARKDWDCKRESRLVKQDFSEEICIYNDKVAIISYDDKELIGMIIKNKNIANTQRAIFEMAWKFAKR